MKPILLLSGFAALLILASLANPGLHIQAERGKVVASGTSQSMHRGGGLFMFAALGPQLAAEDSITVNGEVCELSSRGVPTGRTFGFRGKKFPARFRFADDCEGEGDYVRYTVRDGEVQFRGFDMRGDE
jgi:hypothetical protein